MSPTKEGLRVVVARTVGGALIFATFGHDEVLWRRESVVFSYFSADGWLINFAVPRCWRPSSLPADTSILPDPAVILAVKRENLSLQGQFAIVAQFFVSDDRIERLAFFAETTSIFIVKNLLDEEMSR
jgi:hypothetical protein